MTAASIEIRSELRRAAGRASRELATPDNDGLRVQLLWHPSADAITVEIEDMHAGDRFHVEVARERALDPFYHPFAYAANHSHRAQAERS